MEDRHAVVVGDRRERAARDQRVDRVERAGAGGAVENRPAVFIGGGGVEFQFVGQVDDRVEPSGGGGAVEDRPVVVVAQVGRRAPFDQESERLDPAGAGGVVQNAPSGLGTVSRIGSFVYQNPHLRLVPFGGGVEKSLISVDVHIFGHS